MGNKDQLKKYRNFLFILLFFGLIFLFQPTPAAARGEAKLFLSPAFGSFVVGSTFDVSIIVDTDDVSINTVKIDLRFPADYLQIVTPSTGKSFVSLWLAQPTYSNIKGTVNFAGGKPDGIKTSSGIISVITFRAIKSGEATIEILPSSSVLAHDGKGTEILSVMINGLYALKPKPPEGPKVFSKTHPDETVWYNNNNPIVSWQKESEVSGFSYVLDNYPQTVPDNIPDIQETTAAYQDLADGLWYFHIKSQKENVWGSPSHFLIRIDTTPPARFSPKIEYLLAQITGRALVYFSTTDALSGIDRYEVAVIDKNEPLLESPIFIEAESPFQLPQNLSENLKLIVRSVDKAGNIRDESTDVNLGQSLFSRTKDNIAVILLIAVISAFIIFKITPIPLRYEIISYFNHSTSKILNGYKNKKKKKKEKSKI